MTILCVGLGRNGPGGTAALKYLESGSLIEDRHVIDTPAIRDTAEWTAMIELTMLPAGDGDCLLLSFGPPGDCRRVLIDGGRKATYNQVKPLLLALDPPALDLLVVTHIDQDHALGALALLHDLDGPEVEDVWFNGFVHLTSRQFESFGVHEGEGLTTALLARQVPWNAAFGGGPVHAERALSPELGGGRFTIISPRLRQLAQLAPIWKHECTKHGLVAGFPPIQPVSDRFEMYGPLNIDSLAASTFVPDTSKTNASSIAFLFEYGGVRILFTGDGDDQTIVEWLRPIASIEGGRVRLDALKVSHHGSSANTSKELLDLIDCSRYLISTDGSRHAHPDPVTISRILAYGGLHKELVFNYRKRAAVWDSLALQKDYGYVVTTAAETDGFVTLTWAT